MQLRADIQLRAAIKALTDTVAPAIDPAHKLALEQVQMVIGALTIVEQNLPLQFRFDCNELARLLRLAKSMMGGDGSVTALDGVVRAADAGARVLDRARADPADVLNAVRDLRAECGAATTTLFRDGSPAARKAITDTVLGYSKEQTLHDRSWLLNVGFEPAGSGVPPIEQLLASDALASVDHGSGEARV